MCATHSSSFKFTTGSLYLIAITVAILGSWLEISFLQVTGQIISDTFIKIFKCISLPLISLSIIATLSQYRFHQGMGLIWKKTLLYTIGTTLIAASVSMALYYLIGPSNVTKSIHTGTFSSETSSKPLHYLNHISTLIPSHILEPFIEHHVIGALLISLVVGLAIGSMKEDEGKNMIAAFFKGTHGIFLVITGWIVKIIPIALFGFIISSITQIKSGMHISGLGGYLTVVIMANVIQGLVILPLWLRSKGIEPYATLKAVMPALTVAFFSKSSTGTLPITIETAEKNLKINPTLSRFILPLCTTINMNGCAAFIFATVVFLMQNNGIELSFMSMVLWIFIATLAAIGNAGVPMGCFFLSASLLTSMDVPITLLGLILPFYSIIDMVETSLNVWSDVCVTKVIDHESKA